MAQPAKKPDLLEWAEKHAPRLANSMYAGHCYVYKRKSGKLAITQDEPDAPVEDGEQAPKRETLKKGDYAALQARIEAAGLEVSCPPGHEKGAEIVVTQKLQGKKRRNAAGELEDNPDAGKTRYLLARRLDRDAQVAWERKMDEQRPARVKQEIAAI